MLKQRIITALVLVAFVMLALFASNPLYWRALISLVVLTGFYEWLRFCGIQTWPLKFVSYLLFGLALYALQMAYVSTTIIVALACALWVALLVFTMTDAINFLHNQWLKLAIGIAILSVAGTLVINFKTLENGPLWILCFMVSIWAADVGAYFVGKRFGKTKLAPKVSPGKTVDGFFGGLALVLIIYLPVLYLNFPPKAASLLLLTVLFTAVVSVGGDLFESKLKRHAGLKDSSNILPGHGGVLDRIDSLLAGGPVFAAGLLLLGYLH
jgi:phosphatidate cytidylyltransferase